MRRQLGDDLLQLGDPGEHTGSLVRQCGVTRLVGGDDLREGVEVGGEGAFQPELGGCTTPARLRSRRTTRSAGRSQ